MNFVEMGRDTMSRENQECRLISYQIPVPILDTSMKMAAELAVKGLQLHRQTDSP